ncbi:hypothetical protein [Pseudomonas shahriarae]|uniref:hypothetical protein n=1 Tax=Pseudomonas shahriarae TaxID=2745512 RepID=UPI00235E53E6|nr:hypothetical protein [Pseudomonas shahriarae]MDD1134786.1 hypothetical protein [Pseudomonas shahriarae]
MDLLGGLKDAIEAFLPFKRLGGIGITKARNRITTPFRVEKLSDDFFNSNLKFGSTITVKGVLSRYASTYRPLSYVPTIPRRASVELGGYAIDIEKNKLLQKRSMKATFSTFQFPVQALPPVKSEVGKFCIAYLYPEGFNSFLLDGDPAKKENLSDKLLITDSNRPIPVLVPELMLENFSESLVTLTGIVSMIPEDIANLLADRSCETLASFNRAFHRASSVRVSFCIDCRDPLNSDIKLEYRLDSLPGAIYVEGHFEGVVDDTYRHEFKSAVPSIMDFDFGFVDYPGKILYVTANQHISIIGSLPSVFGFYAETDLVDGREFDAKLTGLQKFYTDFRKTAGKAIKSKNGFDAKFKPDFIFDSRRQNFFHPEGVLANKEVDEVLKKHTELSEVTSWLNNKE